ncbi:MOSC domain-containing protein [Marinobacter sp. ANT_B65]|uniref:MOSC domain-containing protein n=1 Tax=Marinobacter sp. ANT_B65 TaxID=2039467 RepID=UPI000BBE9D5B|nr:MOSC domain-containing protein [Marinobacter sp. ANT_B65]PCM44775.1 MOSC domain-containing protein [Marinobacter sp. ANT_B65]
MDHPITLMQLRTGRLRNLGSERVQTGIFKTCITSSYLSESGLEHDCHGDKRHHGGLEKALHQYASEHYALLRPQLPEPAASHCTPGAFGENLVTHGMSEGSVCVGDVYQFGDALVQISQPRQPCWRLNLRFGIPDMSRRLQNTLRTGWYYRVLQPGLVRREDTLRLKERPQEDWPLSRILSVLYENTMDQQALTTMAGLTELSPNLRQLATKRLETGGIEDWEKRLYGPIAG